MIRPERAPKKTRPVTVGLSIMLAWPLLTPAFSARAAILWSEPETRLVCNNGKGVDVLHGAVKPQDSNSSSTLYFRFRVDPIADSATKSIADFDAGFVLFEKGEEHLGLGSSRVAWAYCAMNVTNSPKGYVDLNSAAREPGFNWEYMRSGVPKYIAFKVEFVPGHDARVTAWLNPDLSPGATEINQPTNIVTRFEAKATFDEIHLLHDGGSGGWKFSQMVAATSFEDLRLIHFWQRGWFIALIGAWLLVTVAGTTQFLERRRVKRKILKLEQEKTVATERARIARDIHDELGANLTKIHKLAEMMDEHRMTQDNMGTFPKTISNTASDTIQAMDEIVWAVNPKNDTLKEMADYLVFYAEDFLRPSGIAFHLEVALDLPAIPVPAEIRHNLFMVAKEALNNAVKHAMARQIKFGLAYAANRLMVEVSDKGRGFRIEATPATENGLGNMRKRMDAIGGQFSLESEPGQGTTVKFYMVLQEDRIMAQ